MTSVAVLVLLCVRLERWIARGLAVSLFASLLSSTVAQAEEHQTTEREPPAGAIERYNRGRAHYQAGRYREALAELEKALALDPNSPNLVYNVARVHELLGEIDEAIRDYERYRGMLPAHDLEQRERIAATLMRLRGARTQVEEKTPPAPKPEMRRGVADAAFWLTASTGAAVVAAGGVTGVLAVYATKDAKAFVLGKDGYARDRAREVQRAHRLAVSTDALLLVGTALGVTSLLLYMLREEPTDESTRGQGGAHVGLGALPRGAVVTLAGAL